MKRTGLLVIPFSDSKVVLGSVLFSLNVEPKTIWQVMCCFTILIPLQATPTKQDLDTSYGFLFSKLGVCSRPLKSRNPCFKIRDYKKKIWDSSQRLPRLGDQIRSLLMLLQHHTVNLCNYYHYYFAGWPWQVVFDKENQTGHGHAYWCWHLRIIGALIICQPLAEGVWL